VLSKRSHLTASLPVCRTASLPFSSGLHHSLPFQLHLLLLSPLAAAQSYITTPAFAYNRGPRAMAAPALSICPGFLHACASHACSRRYVVLLTSGRFVCRWVPLATSIAFTSTHGMVV
jgi:hypothetical protein